jgi:hypothetical protein
LNQIVWFEPASAFVRTDKITQSRNAPFESGPVLPGIHTMTSQIDEARIQVSVDQDVADALDDLTRVLGLKSRGQTITTALALLEWAAAETAAGKKVASVENERKFVEVLLPCFQRLRRSGMKKASSEDVGLSSLGHAAAATS